jgi:amidase
VRSLSADLPPFHGVPFTVKENIDLGGTSTAHGLKALAGSYPGRDAPIVERMRGCWGDPNRPVPTFPTSRLDGTPTANCGRDREPSDNARTPGASSGGETAALATGMTPLGLGNDTGGSLRWPAQCCGIGSLKPVSGNRSR